MGSGRLRAFRKGAAVPRFADESFFSVSASGKLRGGFEGPLQFQVFEMQGWKVHA